jgi:hypothetical protein
MAGLKRKDGRGESFLARRRRNSTTQMIPSLTAGRRQQREHAHPSAEGQEDAADASDDLAEPATTATEVPR